MGRKIIARSRKEGKNLGILSKVEETVWNKWETSISKFLNCTVCIKSDGYFSKVSSRACPFDIWTRRGIKVVSKQFTQKNMKEWKFARMLFTSIC